jgi:hypothetical protein
MMQRPRLRQQDCPVAGQGKAKEKKLCANFASLRLCVRFCFFGSGLSGLGKYNEKDFL